MHWIFDHTIHLEYIIVYLQSIFLEIALILGWTLINTRCEVKDVRRSLDHGFGPNKIYVSKIAIICCSWLGTRANFNNNYHQNLHLYSWTLSNEISTPVLMLKLENDVSRKHSFQIKHMACDESFLHLSISPPNPINNHFSFLKTTVLIHQTGISLKTYNPWLK